MDWTKDFPAAITVCDEKGIILEMNEKSVSTFEKDGGKIFIGTNVLDCHPEPSRTQLENMLKEGITNVYTIEKNGIKKLIYQSPWYSDGKYKGFVEMSFEIPFELPNFIRS